MRRRIPVRAVLFASLAAVLALPMGFAVAQIVQGQSSSESSHLDPDPSSDPVAMGDRLETARAAGDSAGLDRVIGEMRDEIISRLGPEERDGAESAPNEADVPEGTDTYIPPSMPSSIVHGCQQKSAVDKADELCELIVLHAEGKVRSGAFTAAEVDEILAKTNGETR